MKGKQHCKKGGKVGKGPMTGAVTSDMKKDGYKRGGKVKHKGHKVHGKHGKKRLDKMARGGTAKASPFTMAGKVSRTPGTSPATIDKEND